MPQKEKSKSTNWKSVFIYFSTLGVIASLAIVTYKQRRELQTVNQRLNDIENVVHTSRQKRSVTEDDEHLVKLVEKYCETAKKSCAQGEPGFQEQGEITEARSARASACCLGLSTPSYEGAATVTIHTEIGDTVLLPCKASGYPPPSVSWSIPVNSKRYTTSSAGLSIKGVIASDDHAYTCTVTNIFGHKVKVIKLSVTEPISVNLTTSASSHTEGTPGSITLTCNYRGIPDPSVKWLHIDPLDRTHVVTSGVRTSVRNGPISKNYVSTLTLNNPDIFAAGSYICEVRNSLEQRQDNVSIVIFAKPRVVTPPKTQTITEGSNVTLSCTVVGYPPPKITWQFPQSQGHPPFNAKLNSDQTVTLTNVDPFNDGRYKCHAANRYGSAEGSGMITVIKPVLIQMTSQVNSLKNAPAIALDCHASGDPTPTVSWSKLYGHIDSSSHRYIMLPNGDFIITVTPSTMEKDSGVYKCTANNTVSSTSKLAVVYKDMGQLTCTSTFQQCSSTQGVACGGKCPLGCASQPGVLYGFETYSGNSYVCQAGIQFGSITDSGGLVLWYIRDGIHLTFTGKTANGINSGSTGPIHVAATVVNIH